MLCRCVFGSILRVGKFSSFFFWLISNISLRFDSVFWKRTKWISTQNYNTQAASYTHTDKNWNGVLKEIKDTDYRIWMQKYGNNWLCLYKKGYHRFFLTQLLPSIYFSFSLLKQDPEPENFRLIHWVF